MNLANLTALLAQRRKFLVALAGVIAVILSTGLASGDVAHYLTVALSLLTAIGVHALPNAPTAEHEPEHAAPTGG